MAIAGEIPEVQKFRERSFCGHYKGDAVSQCSVLNMASGSKNFVSEEGWPR